MAIETYENSVANDSKKEPKLFYSYMKRKLINNEGIHFLRNVEGHIFTDRDCIGNTLNNILAQSSKWSLKTSRSQVLKNERIEMKH